MTKGFTTADVERIWERAQAACERCGRVLSFEQRGYAWSIHHRRPRGQGGTSLAWVNKPANGVALCGSGVTGCHSWVETNREQAYDQGWLVRRNSIHLPENVPIRHVIYGYITLTNDGGYEPA